MSLPFPEGSVARASDSEVRSLQKIVDLLAAGGGGGGYTQWTEGAGAPAGVPTNPNVFNGYYRTDTDQFYGWDTGTQAWKI